MANRRNAIQKIRADAKKRQRNQAILSELKTRMRGFLRLAAEKTKNETKPLYQQLFSRIDKAVKKGVLKENTASRRKARASRAFNRAKS